MSGAVCLDIVNTCDHYPAEDEDLFASASVKARGGNVANALAVLCELRSRRREVLASARPAATPDAGDDELHLDLFAVLGGDPEAKCARGWEDWHRAAVPLAQAARSLLLLLQLLFSGGGGHEALRRSRAT